MARHQPREVVVHSANGHKVQGVSTGKTRPRMDAVRKVHRGKHDKEIIELIIAKIKSLTTLVNKARCPDVQERLRRISNNTNGL